MNGLRIVDRPTLGALFRVDFVVGEIADDRRRMVPESSIGPLLLGGVAAALGQLAITTLTTDAVMTAKMIASNSTRTFAFAPGSTAVGTSSMNGSFSMIFSNNLIKSSSLGPSPFPAGKLRNVTAFLLGSFGNAATGFDVALTGGSNGPMATSEVSTLTFGISPGISSTSTDNFFGVTNSKGVPGMKSQRIYFGGNNDIGGYTNNNNANILRNASRAFAKILGFDATIGRFALDSFELHCRSVGNAFNNIAMDKTDNMDGPKRIPAPTLLPNLLNLNMTTFHGFGARRSRRRT